MIAGCGSCRNRRIKALDECYFAVRRGRLAMGNGDPPGTTLLPYTHHKDRGRRLFPVAHFVGVPDFSVRTMISLPAGVASEFSMVTFVVVHP